jgi:ATP-dependent protease Clp ATPase subunit
MSTLKNEGEKIFHCSFCGKSQHDVSTLIAGPNGAICNECIEMGMDMLRLKGKESAIRQLALGCAFCGKSQLDVSTLIAGPNCAICNECFEIGKDVLREESTSHAITHPIE